uniref:Uncharacterized protein n=1 Tax=Anguilla anguilla TaxID=7936 RepID=A0A0E9R990_ANGAN
MTELFMFLYNILIMPTNLSPKPNRFKVLMRNLCSIVSNAL